jgi:hypothetical protein
MRILNKIINIPITTFRILGYLLIGYVATILAAISAVFRIIKNKKGNKKGS